MSSPTLGYACHRCKRLFPNQLPRQGEEGQVHCVVCSDSIIEIIESESHLAELRAQYPRTRQDTAQASPFTRPMGLSSSSSSFQLPPMPMLAEGSTLEVTYRVVDPQGVRSTVTQIVVTDTDNAQRAIQNLHNVGSVPSSSLRMPTNAAAVSEAPVRVEPPPLRSFVDTLPRPGLQAGGFGEPLHMVIRNMFRGLNQGGDDEHFQHLQTQILQLAGHRAAPTSQSVLASLPTVSGGVTIAMKERDPAFARGCSICQEDFNEESGGITMLPCGHYHHTECIIPWLQTAQTCPDCRVTVAGPVVNDTEEGDA